MTTEENYLPIDPFLAAEIRSAIFSALDPGHADRFLGVAPGSNSALRLDMDSQGLLIADKIDLERQILEALPLTIRNSSRIVVYFRRRPVPDTVAPEGPEGFPGDAASPRHPPPPRPPESVTGQGPGPRQARSNVPLPVPPDRLRFGQTMDRRAIPNVKRVILVASGKGGVGKSTVSANIAVALARRGRAVGLLDADVLGPSAHVMLGVAGQMSLSAKGMLVPRTAHGVKLASFGLLTDESSPAMWRGPMVAKAIRNLCYDVEWGPTEELIVDLPPGTGDVQLSLIEMLPLHAAIVVTTPQLVAVADAKRAVAMFDRLDVPILGLVVNMSGIVCASCGVRTPFFPDQPVRTYAAERRISILAEIPLDPDLASRCDSGNPMALDDGAPVPDAFLRLSTKIIETSEAQ